MGAATRLAPRRLAAGVAVAALWALGLVSSPGAHLACAVGLGIVVVVTATFERSRAAAWTWTALTALGAAGVALARGGASAALTEQVASLAVLPAGLVALGWISARQAARVRDTSAIGDVARAKLVRSNRELRRSMGGTEAALGKLSAIVDNLTDGLVAAEDDGRIEIANHALSDLLEVPAPTPGDDLDALLPASLRALVERSLESEEVVQETLALEDGRAMLVTVSPVRLGDALWGTVTLIRDVTLQHEIDRMKSDFVSTVSHEMRTPLTSLLGFTKLIHKRLEKTIFPLIGPEETKALEAAETVRGNLDVVEQEGHRLTALINDVLDLSKMESGQMEWTLGPRAPSALVERALAATSSLFDSDGPVQVERAIAQDLPAVHADGDRVQQVLINLISNAAKFTEEGKITVAARLVDEGVELSVADTGPGIRPAHREVIFEKFKQVGEVLTDRPTGTGLGLPICREIIHHHGGTIWVESEVGVGSRFAFTLPLAES